MTQELRGIGGAWAGGADGMAITNTVLQQLPVRHNPILGVTNS